MSINSQSAGYQAPVRKIRQVLDPNQLYDRQAAITQGAQSGADFQNQYNSQVIQRRMQEQAAKQAAAERKRQQEMMAAQNRANNSTAARNQKYGDSLYGYAASTPQVTFDSANMNPNHSAAYQRSLNYANNQVRSPSKDWTRMCQSFARTAAHAQAFGTTAYQAWNNTPDQNRHFTYPPRPGSIAYYANPKNPGAGHSVFVGDNGKVYSTDIKRTGKIDIVNWDIFQNKWGMSYLGWIDATPSGRLPVQG